MLNNYVNLSVQLLLLFITLEMKCQVKSFALCDILHLHYY